MIKAYIISEKSNYIGSHVPWHSIATFFLFMCFSISVNQRDLYSFLFLHIYDPMNQNSFFMRFYGSESPRMHIVKPGYP